MLGKVTLISYMFNVKFGVVEGLNSNSEVIKNITSYVHEATDELIYFKQTFLLLLYSFFVTVVHAYS